MGTATNDRARARARGFTIVVLIVALIVGGYLRCANLGAREMSADEGASWAAAAAPTLREVLLTQNRLNPGKAGLHDLALHFWLRAFGDHLATMRALSAAIGTLTILLVFGAAWEILAATCDDRDATVSVRDDGNRGGTAIRHDDHGLDAMAGIAALVFAVNLVAIKYSREVRMYPLVIAAVVAQTWCFFRAYRRGGFGACAGVAIFTALALAAHLTAVLAFSGEVVWMTYVMAKRRFTYPRSKYAV